MQQVASYSDAQTSQATATLRQQLESEIVSVAASTDETATKRTHDAEARIRRDVEAELQKNQADTRREVEQTRTAVDNIATRLDQLTTQLNEYRPAGGDSGGTREKIVYERRNTVAIAFFALGQLCSIVIGSARRTA